MSDATRLACAQGGDPDRVKDLLPTICQELRGLAAAKMALKAPSQTLQPTALVPTDKGRPYFAQNCTPPARGRSGARIL